MKKHLLMIIVLFLITGCSKDIKTEVYSNIEKIMMSLYQLIIPRQISEN